MQYAQQVIGETRKAIVGKDSVLLWVFAAILARGHILLEDIPGVGKTTMPWPSPRLWGSPMAGSSSPRMYCPPTLRAIPYIIRKPAPWSISPARFCATYFWRTS